MIADEEYFDDIQRVAVLISKKTVPYEEYKKFGKYSAEYIFSRFGKWNDFLTKAGLEPTGFGKDKITEQECFDEIERMWRLLGRQPTTTDVVKGDICKYSIDTFKRRFGGWRKALEAFVVYINATDNESEPRSPDTTTVEDSTSNNIVDTNGKITPPKHRTTRNINTRLRFRVLARDNFKCCACGAAGEEEKSA